MIRSALKDERLLQSHYGTKVLAQAEKVSL